MGWFIFEMTKVHGNSGQWWSLRLRELPDYGCRQHHSFSNHYNNFFVIYFPFHFLELTYIRLLPFSHWTPSPVPSKKGNFRAWSLTVPKIFIITHTRDGVTLQDRVPGLPSSSTRFLSHSVARSDIPGLAHSTEGLGRCDRTALVHFCTTPL